MSLKIGKGVKMIICGFLNIVTVIVLFILFLFFLLIYLRTKKIININISLISLIFLIIVSVNYITSDDKKNYKKEFISDVLQINSDINTSQEIFAVFSDKYYYILTENSINARVIKRFHFSDIILYENDSKKPQLINDCTQITSEGFLYDVLNVEVCKNAAIIPKGTLLMKFNIK